MNVVAFATQFSGLTPLANCGTLRQRAGVENGDLPAFAVYSEIGRWTIVESAGWLVEISCLT